MKLIAPNPLVIEVSYLFARLLRTLIATGNVEAALSEAYQSVWHRGSPKLIDLWNMTEDPEDPMMHSGSCSHLRFPFIYAIK
jgi:hypothetical protein